MPSHFAVGKPSTADVEAAMSRKRDSDSRPTHDLHASFLKRADSASARSINRACTASSTCSEEVVVNTMSLAAPVRAGVLATARPAESPRRPCFRPCLRVQREHGTCHHDEGNDGQPRLSPLPARAG